MSCWRVSIDLTILKNNLALSCKAEYLNIHVTNWLWTPAPVFACLFSFTNRTPQVLAGRMDPELRSRFLSLRREVWLKDWVLTTGCVKQSEQLPSHVFKRLQNLCPVPVAGTQNNWTAALTQWWKLRVERSRANAPARGMERMEPEKHRQFRGC